MTKKDNSYQNWIHFDFKGMHPSESRLVEWLSWVRDNGFSGLVLEYEDRLPWKTFEGTWRPGFELDVWQRIWRHCAKIGLEVTPLIQTYGHLECLLKHKRWAHLRCGKHVNLLCPLHPEVRPLLKSWIEEVAALHPASEYLHVGLDEVYHMGECQVCQKRAAELSLGKMGLLLEHASFVCETVSKLGKRPIIWADMFLHSGNTGLLQQMPADTVICEWTYTGDVGKGTRQLAEITPNALMGASAIRRSFPSFQMVADVTVQVDNVCAWHVAAAEQPAVKILLHTLWARSRGLSALYGPWEGWLPAFQVAGRKGRNLSSAMEQGMALLSQGLNSNNYEDLERYVAQLQELSAEPDLEKRALKWWELALRYHAELLIGQYYSLHTLSLRASNSWMGEDPDLTFESSEILRKLRERLQLIQDEVKEFLTLQEWSNGEEYLESRFGGLETALAAIEHISSAEARKS